MNILIIQEFGLGDLILSIPAIASIKLNFKKSKLTIPLSKDLSNLAKLIPYIDECIEFPGSFEDRIKFLKSIRKRYDVVYILNPGILGYLTNIFSCSKKKIGYTNPVKSYLSRYNDQAFYEVDRYLNIIKSVGLKAYIHKPFLKLTPTEIKYRSDFFKKYRIKNYDLIVSISPGSKRPQKRWPKENFAYLADWLINEYNAKIFFFGDRTEVRLINNIIHLMKNKPISLVGQTSLSELAAIISISRLFISNDTGPMHIASSLKIPIFALFGPSNPHRFRPIGRKAVVIKKDLDCSPCNYTRDNKCKDNICMQLIGVEEVKEKIKEKFLHKYIKN